MANDHNRWCIWWRDDHPRWQQGAESTARLSKGTAFLFTDTTMVWSWHSSSPDGPVPFDCGRSYIIFNSKDKLIKEWKDKAVAQMLLGKLPSVNFYEVTEFLDKGGLQ